MAGWITINGTHVYVKDGESVEEAFSRTTGASLSTKGNPEQTSNAKKFSINDALRNAAKEKLNKFNEKINKAAMDENEIEVYKQNGRLDSIRDDAKESEKLTEKGRQARIDRENKAKEKDTEEKDPNEKEKSSNNENNAKESNNSSSSNKNNYNMNKLNKAVRDEEVLKFADEEELVDFINDDPSNDFKYESKVTKEMKDYYNGQLFQVNGKWYMGQNEDMTESAFIKKEDLGVNSKGQKNLGKTESGKNIISEKDWLKNIGGKKEAAKRAAKYMEAISNSASKPRLGAPEKGNMLSVGTYKGYSIDKDIYGGNGVTVNIDGEEVMYNSAEEAMKDIDKLAKKK